MTCRAADGSTTVDADGSPRTEYISSVEARTWEETRLHRSMTSRLRIQRVFDARKAAAAAWDTCQARIEWMVERGATVASAAKELCTARESSTAEIEIFTLISEVN